MMYQHSLRGNFNDLIDKVEKRLYNIEDQITGMQVSDPFGKEFKW